MYELRTTRRAAGLDAPGAFLLARPTQTDCGRNCSCIATVVWCTEVLDCSKTPRSRKVRCNLLSSVAARQHASTVQSVYMRLLFVCGQVLVSVRMKLTCQNIFDLQRIGKCTILTL